MTEVEQQPPPQNGIDLSSANEDDDNSKSRPADIEQDMREMERRKRVEAIMSSRLFREELERIVDAARDGGGNGAATAGILQQLSDIVGLPVTRVGSVFKTTNCMLPINDIRGVESMGYAKGEKILRCKLAATFRLLDLYGWTQGQLGAQITARLKVDQEYFLVNPYGLLYHEITASSLNKADMQGQIVEQGTTNFGVFKSHFMLHSAVHAARPDIRCAIYIGCSPVVAISSLKSGLLPISRDACVLGEVTTHPYTGSLEVADERDKMVRNLGPNSKIILLTNHGALCCGETIEEAFFAACHIVQACETQLKLLPVGLDNIVLISEESRKAIYEQSRRPPEDLAKTATDATTESLQHQQQKENDGTVKVVGATPKWRVGGAEFEALMRTLDNAGFRTGYIYRHPLIKSDPPKPKNDVELPPAVSSLGYLLEEEELFRQGIWKKGDLRKGGDRSRWLNSPNVYQKVEVLETGTPDPKKITKWVAEGSPTHSTPVRIEDPLQFVPAGTNTKEFKRVQQQIKDNRRADKISAGPQSHILEGVTWDEANRCIKDATITTAGDHHVVLMGAASKGIIQRGYQHNATVYKTPYAKNPFDNVTDDELNEYKRTVERKKKSIHGEYTDTDFSESEPLSSLQTSGAQQQIKQNTITTTTTTTAAVSQSETEDASEHQVLRIETQQAPVPSQAEVVLSDASLSFINGERSHTATNRKPPTGRVNFVKIHTQKQNVNDQDGNDDDDDHKDDGDDQEDKSCGKIKNGSKDKNKMQFLNELNNATLFQRQKIKLSQGERNDVEAETNCTGIPNDKQQQKQFLLMNFDGQCHCCGCCCDRKSVEQSEYINSEALYAYANEYNINNIQSNAIANFDDEVINCPNSMSMLNCVDDDASTYTLNHRSDNYPLKKSIFCCTPTICERILTALQEQESRYKYDEVTATTSSIYCNDYNNNNNEMSEILENSTRPPPNSPQKPLQNKHQTNYSYYQYNQHQQHVACSRIQRHHNYQQSIGPYRTVSHFGFKAPQHALQPDHKHIPATTTTTMHIWSYGKYIPVRKAVSYEEIFSSPRYLNLCENCFERIVRAKPELLHMEMRLRNLVNSSSSHAQSVPSSTKIEASQLQQKNLKQSMHNYDDDDNESISLSSTNSPMPGYVTSALEPLIEESETDGDNNDDDVDNAVVGTKGVNSQPTETTNTMIPTAATPIECNNSINSSFIEKIMALNYSEVSTNLNFLKAPRHVTSNLTLESIRDDATPPSILVSQAKSLPPLVSSTITTSTAAIAATPKNPKVSILEIVNFNNWQQRQQDECDDGKKISSEQNQNNDSPTVVNNTCWNEVSESLPAGGVRLLMSRDERCQRKFEFQELWEDHIAYYSGRSARGEQNAYSDTESAIFVGGPGEETIGEERGDDSILKIEIEPSTTEAEVEIFHSHSVIMRSQIHKVGNDDACNEPANDHKLGECQEEQPISGSETYKQRIECTTTDDEISQQFEAILLNCDVNDENLSNEFEQILESNGGNNDMVDDAMNDITICSASTNMHPNEEMQKAIVTSAPIPTLHDGVYDDVTNEQQHFNSLELEILNKIEVHHLKEEEEIFDKIDTSIRNKLTPLRLESLIKQQQQEHENNGVEHHQNNSSNNDDGTFASSTPTHDTITASEERFKSLSLTFIATDEKDELNTKSATSRCIKRPNSASPHIRNQSPASTSTTSTPRTSRSSFELRRRQRRSTPPSLKLQTATCKRNFIMENIHNASTPRNIKRLQQVKSSQAIFCRNPFDVAVAVTDGHQAITTSNSVAITNNATNSGNDTIAHNGKDTIYSFQSKVVRGSPRFWLSMTQKRRITRNVTNKSVNNVGSAKKRFCGQKNSRDCNQQVLHSNMLEFPKNDSDSAADSATEHHKESVNNIDCIFNDDSVGETDSKLPNVEREIKALGVHINALKPRLQNYAEKFNDYVTQVSNCTQHLNDCVTVQQHIADDQQQLRDEIRLNQYAEKVQCDAQTFSISETED